MTGETTREAEEGGHDVGEGWDGLMEVPFSEVDGGEKSQEIPSVFDLVKNDLKGVRERYSEDEVFRRRAEEEIDGLIENGNIYGGVYTRVLVREASLKEIEENTEDYLFNSENEDERNKGRNAVLVAKMRMMEENYPIRDDEGREYAEQMFNQRAYGAFARDFLRLSGYPEEDVGDMVAAMGGAISHEDGGRQFADRPTGEEGARFVNVDELRRRLVEMSLLVGELGADGVGELRRECGILNFSNYSIEELKWQYRWLKGDEEAIERYSTPEEPITLVIRDGIGDWNGGFSRKSITANYGRTLVFEVGDESRGALQRYGDLLEDKNVYPTALVVGAHGHDMGHAMLFGDAYLVSTRYDDFDRFPVVAWEDPEMVKLLQIVRPNKYGERSVIIDSCSQGKEEGGVAEIVAEVAHHGQPESVTTNVYAATGHGAMGRNGAYEGSLNAGSDGSSKLVSVTMRGDGTMERRTYEQDAVYDREQLEKNIERYLPSKSRRYTRKVIEEILNGKHRDYKYERQEMVRDDESEEFRPREDLKVEGGLKKWWGRRRNGKK